MNMRKGKGLFFVVFASLLISIMLCYRASALETHQNIQGPFTSTGEVTTACLKCHQQQAVEVLQSTHWTWVRQHTVNGKNSLYGKKDSLTGFTIDVSSNPSRCMGCHVSTTRPNVNLDAAGPEMVDCLVCHDTTGTYQLSIQGESGDQNRNSLELIARNVGKPAPVNCTTCHFANCGLPVPDKAKRSSLANILPFHDVHMDQGMISFTCQDCHIQNSGHTFTRKINRTNNSFEKGCASCHTTSPHVIDQLNQHTTTIACQTCHIPQYAQKKPAIISWNWIMTGKTSRGYQNPSRGRTLIQDENGFTSSTDLEPVYLWDDGGDRVYTRGQRIRPQELTYLQRPSEKSSNSKIAPFRVVYSTQLYDTKYRYLISPLMQPTGPTFFPSSDWGNVARQGMQAIVLPFSGQYAFAPTASFKRINHGVASSSESLSCLDCHGSNGRMPWEKLGYEEDPWSRKTQISSENERLDKKLPPEPPTELQPTEELKIPPDSSL